MGTENNFDKHFFDVWSLGHACWGFLFLLVLLGVRASPLKADFDIIALAITVFLHLCWEIYENTEHGIRLVRKLEIWQKGKTSYQGDTAINTASDTLWCVFGCMFVYGMYVSVNFGYFDFLSELFK